ncbi:CZB domain-containing protein [Celeribacter neptunius]|uniref:CZB domain-containing protein n=1 Tax=Celeribacter neptunius TaxID=588602 RepID=UPI0015A684EB|nr:CZB domain-containing protein [Celeribacter neptunius]
MDWLRKFAVSLETGKLDRSAHDISCDDRCDFGQWLTTLRADPNDPAMEKLDVIKALHSRFHRYAGEIAGRLEAGEKENAHARFTSPAFKRVTNSLVLNLNDWRQDFKPLMV